MTTSTYKELEPFKERLSYAKTVRYARFDKQEQGIFFRCYKEAFGTELTRAEKACPHCMLKACVRLYEAMLAFEKTPAYHKYKKGKENAENESTEA